MRAVKDNRCYSINTDAEARAYKAQGFDIYDDDNTLKAHGDGKTVTVDEFSAVNAENQKLKSEIAELNSQIAELTAKVEKAKAEKTKADKAKTTKKR